MADHFNTPQPPDAAEQEQLAPHRVDSEGTFDYLERFSGMDISHLSGNRSTTLDADAVSIVSPAEVKARLGFAAPVFAEISMTTDDRKLLLNYWVLSLDRAGRPGDLLIVDPKQYDVQNKRGFIGVHGEQPLTVNVLNGKYKDRFTLDGQYPAPNFTIQRKGNGVVIRNAEGWYQLDVSRPRGWRRAYGQPFGAMALAGNHEPTIIKPETSVDDTVATDDVNHAEDTSDIAADDGDARNDVVIAATEVSAETVHTESSDAAATSSEGHREDASETADTASEAAPHSDTADVANTVDMPDGGSSGNVEGAARVEDSSPSPDPTQLVDRLPELQSQGGNVSDTVQQLMQVGAGRNVLDRLASWASNGVNPAAVLDAMVDRNGAHYLRDIGNMMAFLRGNSELARNSEVRELLRSKYGLKYFYPDEIYERLGEYPEHRVVHVVDPDNPRRLYPLE